MAKNNAKKKAALRKANHFMKEVPGIALRLVMYIVVTVVLGLLFSMVQGIENYMLRIAITLAVAAVILIFYFNEGVSKGTTDALNSRQLVRLEKAGKTITAKEDASCYHPLKAVCGALLVFCLPLALAIVLALFTKDYTYILQDLPVWLSGSYGYREDVMGPLAAYMQMGGTTALDWIRIIVRMFVLVFVNLFEDPQLSSALIDRTAALFILIYPLAYVLGYLRGPSEQAKMEKANKKAKKIAVRKQQKSNLVEELLGESNVPHYGHQREKDKPKKKELI